MTGHALARVLADLLEELRRAYGGGMRTMSPETRQRYDAGTITLRALRKENAANDPRGRSTDD